MKHRGVKFLSLLLTLAMLVGLMPGMGLTAYAASYENIEITSAVFGATSVSTLIDSLDGFCKLSSAEAKSWDPPTKSGNVRLIRNYDEDHIRITIFVNGQYVNDAGISLEQAKAYDECKYYYAKKTVVAVNSVTLSPATVTLTAGGEAVAMTATVSPDNATDKKVKWSVGGTDTGAVKLYFDADCTTEVGANATSTMTVYAKGISAGNATVTVTSNADATKSASCAVTVSAVTYTVTYDANGGSGEMKPTKVSKNDEGKYIYKVESCGFTAPEGETFDYWLGSDGKTYRPGPEVEISGDLTLKAQWKDEEKKDSGEKKTSGGGSGFDLVFNIPGMDNSWEYVGGYVAPQQAYRVSLAPMQGGSAALGLTTGESGVQMNVYPTTTVYVFPNAAQGYVLDKIVWSLIDGSASYDITEAKNFVMPAMDVVVYVTFQPLAS